MCWADCAAEKLLTHVPIPYTFWCVGISCRTFWTSHTENPVQIKPGVSEYKHIFSRSALYAFAVYKAITLHTCMSSRQRNPCTDCKSAQYCTTRGHPLPLPKLHPSPCSIVWECAVGQTDGLTYRQTHRQTHKRPWPMYISLCCASREMSQVHAGYLFCTF